METHSEDRLTTVGSRIRAVRLALGLTAADLAEQIGISRPTFSIWENDRVEDPDEMKLTKLAKVLDVSADWLIRNKGKVPAIAMAPARSMVGARGKDRITRLDHVLKTPETLPPENIRMLTDVDKSVPEIKATAAQFDDRHHDTSRWTMPREVLKHLFHCDPDNVVIKQARKAMTALDGTPVGRGDYILIDKTRTAIDEPGHYYVADPQGREAHRATATADAQTGELTVQIDGSAHTFNPDEGWAVMGRVMGVFHALP